MRRPAFLIALSCVACAHGPPIDRQTDADSAVGAFTVRYADVDASSAQQVSLAISHAGPRLVLWGHLAAPVVVVVEPSHDALEHDVDRRGFGWLRAWARYRQVWVQSPRTWGWGGEQQNVDELLLHELTHCVMYQLAGTETDWPTKGIPIWFREGMASYTANQGYRRGSLAQLAQWYATHGDDPVADADALYKSQSEVVYDAAHLAFTFLVERYGVAGVQRVLAGMREGASFDAAFAGGIGLNRRDFERDFTTYVKLRGWAR